MEPAPQTQKPQRSPWFYVLLGCGAFALLSCLGVGAFFAFVAKKGSDMVAGMSDPKVREENAVQQLGGIPEGYYPAASFNMFGVMQMTVLVDQPPDEDGGFDLRDSEGRAFLYFRVMAMEDNKATKEFFTTDSKDTRALAKKGIHIDARDIVKRGNFTRESGKLYYVTSRGTVGTGNGQAQDREGLNTSVLFDCPGDQLHIGVWTQADPSPDTAAEELELTGTVADEAELKKFLANVDPCGR